ncbi:MAG: hypothetical protein ACTSWN_10410 [Promethearchaeota archaeon]
MRSQDFNIDKLITNIERIREPLAIINNSVYYISKKLSNSSGKEKKHLDMIQQQVQRSNKIVDDILTIITKIEK